MAWWVKFFTIRIGKFWFRLHLALDRAQTQPHYEAPGYLRAKIVKNALINIWWVSLSPLVMAQSWLWGS